MAASDLQVWDNAAFDNGESEEQFPWSTAKSSSLNLSPSQSQSSSPIKENLSPNRKPNRPTPRLVSKPGISEIRKDNPPKDRDVSIDSEIEEIEKEINRLSSRLEELRLEKAKRNAKLMEKRGRVVAAKFMDSKPSSKTSDGTRVSDESIGTEISKLRNLKRGVSLGPAEIMRAARRGMSLGPAEIYSATKLKQIGISKQQEMTPKQQAQNRRKSCFWKLEEIDEVTKVKNERGKSFSLSPKSRKPAPKSQALKQGAVTTGGSKKFVKKEDGITPLVQPKTLFKDGEKSIPSKKIPPKNGRVVPSRYNQTNSTSALELRKRSLAENDNEDGKRSEKRVNLNGSRIKKRWEVPNHVEIKSSVIDDTVTPLSVTKMLDLVPKIRTGRCVDDSPRDSGPAKRVSELVGRRSYFSMENSALAADEYEADVDDPLCQELSFGGEVAPNEYPMISALCSIEESPGDDSGTAKRVSELMGRKPFFDDSDDDDDGFGTSVIQALSFA